MVYINKPFTGTLHFYVKSLCYRNKLIFILEFIMPEIVIAFFIFVCICIIYFAHPL